MIRRVADRAYLVSAKTFVGARVLV